MSDNTEPVSDLNTPTDTSSMNCDRCQKNPSSGLHRCPYASEINDNNDDEYCNCCDDCTHQCCMDI